MHQKKKAKTGIFRLLEIAGKRKRLLSLSALLAIGHALMTLVPYVLVCDILKALTAPVLDKVLLQQDIFKAVIAVVLSYLLLYASGMASHVAAFNILYELRRQMAEKIGRLSLGFINKTNSGALKKIMSDDVERIENFIAHSIPDFIKGMILPLITLVYLFCIDWKLALASCIPLVLLAVFIPLMFNRKRMDLLTNYHRSLEDMNSGIVEFVRAMPVIKIFGHTAEKFDQYSGAVYRFRDMVIAWVRNSAPAYGIFISFISNATLPVLAAGLYLYFSGSSTLATFSLFLILGVGYIRPLFALSNLGSQISVINHGVKRLDEILFGREQESSGTEMPEGNFEVSFEDVYFGYQQETYTLIDVSFKMPAGSITALVGPSGSGKSTIAQLLSRFWDPQQGRVCIGGKDIRDIAPEVLMKHIAFVFQESFMFRESLYENIRMGMDKSKEQVLAAAKAAQCHDFIMQLEQGYQTRWGSDGLHLSGGEQQRIQLARAILKDAPILILDEATAFSDPENEHLIHKAFHELIRDKTVLIIAHRLSTIVASDQIIVMDKGMVQQTGQHQALLEQSALYARMWQAHTRAKEFAI
ncbi:ABC transporter ATP-binding protein [Pedobacter nutrimenti]|jgi:ATP-binding cassette subfamily B protein|uniref:ATP-binding cassette subfamily B protein n=1 Tax=Pedobacter nutrimenti TaxID=1241337 RepID=A0A318UMS3_9SPHI|nr:ABC transporter ATP-binding protein [Pedobacter nutrimenti]PYF77283.1 ATP-binding cassette subfamily B protein [Pedobacter nutrimenti]